MLKKIVSLALLAALTSAASAQSVASSTSNLIASYDASGGVVLGSIDFDEYNGTLYDDGSEDDYNYEETEGGLAVVDHTGATGHTHVAGTRLFTLTSATSASLHSADYAAIGGLVGAGAFKGAAYYLTFTNNGLASGAVAFTLNSQRAVQGSAASPYGVNYSPDGVSDTPGGFADAAAFAGVTDVTTGLGNSAADGDFRRTSNATSFYEEPGVYRESFLDTEFGTFSTQTFTLDAGETRRYRLYASSFTDVAFYPVPEPASTLALGLGAAGLLRRRVRRA